VNSGVTFQAIASSKRFTTSWEVTPKRPVSSVRAFMDLEIKPDVRIFYLSLPSRVEKVKIKLET
jgi:hypothetical protein